MNIRRSSSSQEQTSNVSSTDPSRIFESEPSSEKHGVISSINLLNFGVPLLLSIAVGISQLTTPGAISGLTAYDDGVYMGAALQWVNGSWPYRDFVFLHPPGIILLMSPIALLAKFTGTGNGLAIARVCTELFSTINVLLAVELVRRHGRVAALITGTLTALFPLAVANSSTLTLEPYLVCCVLIGLVALVRAISNLNFNRWLWVSGVFFGFAGLVKIWAFFPFIAVSICTVIWFARSSIRFFVGALLAFGIPALPFIVLGPGNFYHDVIVDQVVRQASVFQQASLAGRLFDILGFPGLGTSWLTPTFAEIAALAGVAAIVLAFWLDSRAPQRGDVLLIVVTISAIACLVVGREFQLYYSYFSAPFIAISFGVVVHKICRGAESRWNLWSRLHFDARWFRVALAMLVVVGAAALVSQDFSYQRQFIENNLRGNNGSVAQPGAIVSLIIPSGACAISDSPGVLILGNRYLSNTPGCPAIVDPYGMFLALNGGVEPPNISVPVTAFTDRWMAYFREAQYVVLTFPFSDYVPWTTALEQWFNQNYTLISSSPFAYIYEHRNSP